MGKVLAQSANNRLLGVSIRKPVAVDQEWVCLAKFVLDGKFRLKAVRASDPIDLLQVMALDPDLEQFFTVENGEPHE